MRVVLDASAAVHLVLRTTLAPELATALQACTLVLAPTLFHSEVANTLWKYVRAGELSPELAVTRYEEALALVDRFEPDPPFAIEALVAAARHQHPVYDMLYLALARRFGCSMLTADKKLKALSAILL